MTHSFQESDMNTIGNYLKETFGHKVVKLSLDGGFTCPNRDGTKGRGGCLFCSSKGAGDFSGTIPEQIELLSRKWPKANYLAYFQSHTNTYAPVSLLKEKYAEVLRYPGVLGLAIATRPDCLAPEVLSLLDEFNKKTFLWVELGLQTIHEKTADLINRCYPLSVFDSSVATLHKLHIKTVVHLILGLPGETKKQMLASVRYVGAKKPFGVKLHLLNVVKGSRMETLYPDYVPFQSIAEYVNLVCDALELIPPEITIHRLTADAPRPILIAPPWSYQKRTILNGIHHELKRRGTYQGFKISGPNRPSL